MSIHKTDQIHRRLLEQQIGREVMAALNGEHLSRLLRELRHGKLSLLDAANSAVIAVAQREGEG